MKKLIVAILFYLFLFNQVLASIIITELYPNTTDDKNLEYIELINLGSSLQYLSGFYLQDKSEKKYFFGSSSLLGINESIKFYRKETKIILNNENEEIYLYNSSGSLVDSFVYDDTEKGEILYKNNEKIKKIEDNSGSLSTQTGSLEVVTSPIVPPLPGEGSSSGSVVVDCGTGIIEGTGVILGIPEVEIEIQSGLEYMSGNIWNCKKEECKVNLSLEKIFTGSYLEKNYQCNWNFGTLSSYSTGTELKCNPGYVDYGSGIFDIEVNVYEKGNIDNFKTGAIVIDNLFENKEYLLSEEITPPPAPPLIGDGSNSGSLSEGTGSKIIEEETFVEIIPDIVYDFQSPSYLIEKDIISGEYNCDRTKEECKINLDLRNSFTWEIKESDYNCLIDFGFGTGILTGEENKCNPNTIIAPVGSYEVKFKIEDENNSSNFSTGGFTLINEGYIPKVKKSSGSRGNSSKSSKNNVITEIEILKPEIIIQSGLDENNRCKKEVCKINLNYIKQNDKIECLWDFGSGIFTTKGTNKKCNPGYVEYGLGEFEVKLKVYQKDMENNYEERILKIENKIIIENTDEKELREENIIEVEEIVSIQEFDLQKLNQIKIHKVMPNPSGTDNIEYIELINNSQVIINLRGCNLDDKLDGGSKRYDLLEDSIILPGKTKKYYKSETKLNLNNDIDEVNLFCGEDKIDSLVWDFGVRSGYYLNHARLDVVSAKAKVIDVIDGDTIKIKFFESGIIETLRLIGVDTPETKHPTKEVEEFGIIASNFTKNELLGKDIFIEIDKNNFRDKYGRLLGFVFVDDKNFNKKLVEKGYGYAYLKYDFKYFMDFEKAQKIAKKQKMGIWSDTKIEKELIFDEVLFVEKTDNELGLLDINNNLIPDEFEEFSLDENNKIENFTGEIDEINTENLLLDEEKSKQKYNNFVVKSFTSKVTKLKSGLKISGKTIPNSDIFIELQSKEVSLINFFVPKAIAGQTYITKSDMEGNYYFLITDISSGEYTFNTRIIDNFGNIFDIDTQKSFDLSSEYINEMSTYSSEKKDKLLKKYSDEIAIKIKEDELLLPIIDLQGRLGSKKIIGNNIYCYDTCSINFDGTKSTGNIEKYLWDFGNGKSFNGKNPKYIKYENFGTYKLTFTIIGKKGDQKEKFFNIYFGKTTKKKSNNKKLKDIIKDNVLIEVVSADNSNNKILENKIQNNNGNLHPKSTYSMAYFFLIMLFTLTLGFLLLKKEKLI